MQNGVSDNIDKEKTFAELFELDSNKFSEISVFSLNFTRTALEEFKKQNIYFLSDLLLMTVNDFLRVRSIGFVKLNEFFSFLKGLKNGQIDITAYKISNIHNVPLTIAVNRNKIVKGDFSSVEINNSSKQLILKYESAQRDIGQELSETSMITPYKILPICKALLSFYEEQNIIATKRKVLLNLISQVSDTRKSRSINNYIELYPADNNIKNILKKIFRYNSCELTFEEINEVINNNDEYKAVINFLRWLIISPNFYIKELLNKILRSSVNKNIINLRVQGYSFFEIAEKTNYTKEQILIKHNNIIDSYFSDNNSLAAFLLLSLDMGNSKCFTESLLVQEFEALAPVLIYLYSYSKNSRIKVDRKENSIILK